MKANPFYMSGKFAGKRIHLGISGSIACYKACDLLRSLLGLEILVSATLSPGAREFISPLLIRSLGAPVHDSMFRDRDVFAHLAPGQEADLLAVVPASANMLAKLANGLCDDMLAAQCLAFAGPLLIAPAMNPRMWAHPATQANAQILRARGAELVGPASGKVACGTEGQGRLADLTEIFLSCLKPLAPDDLLGQDVLVTLGPTREYWDGVRFWSNPSSGTMGAALATCAWLRGAQIHAICGPDLRVTLPAGVSRIEVVSAKEMFAACLELWPKMSIGICCAAVSDFAPLRPPEGDSLKAAKRDLDGGLAIQFTRNPDILATLARERRPGQKLLGFAAQIAPDLASLAQYAREKLAAKKADLLAANRVNRGDGAFGSDTNSVLVLDQNGRMETWQSLPKADIAWELITWLLTL